MKHLILPLLFAASLAQASVITISDAFEGLSPATNWASFTNFTDNLGTTHTTTYPGLGGNPNHWAKTIESYTSAGAQYEAGYLYTAMTYDPSTQGALNYIDFSLDTIRQTTAGALYVRAIAKQGTVVYVAGNISPSASWTTSTATLNSLSFHPNFSMAHPDFATGGPISFGYLIGSNTYPIAPGVAADLSPTAGVDNFSLQLHTADSAVPEPGTWSTLLIGAGCIGRWRIVRRRLRLA